MPFLSSLKERYPQLDRLKIAFTAYTRLHILYILFCQFEMVNIGLPFGYYLIPMASLAVYFVAVHLIFHIIEYD
jgi:hypothetical protein